MSGTLQVVAGRLQVNKLERRTLDARTITVALGVLEVELMMPPVCCDRRHLIVCQSPGGDSVTSEIADLVKESFFGGSMPASVYNVS